MMWLMAFGSAIHKRFSYKHVPLMSVKSSNTGLGCVQQKTKTYPEWTVPANDVPEILEEPLVPSSSFSGLEIPLVS